MEIVDGHQHVGDVSGVTAAMDLSTPAMDLDSTELQEREFRVRVQSMQNIGIDWAVIQPGHGYLQPEGIKDTMRVNDAMVAYRRRDPVRFPIALGTVEPKHGARSLEEIDRVKHELGLNGLSWHHRFQGVFMDHPWMAPFLRRLVDLELVPFIHTNPGSKLEAPLRLHRLARAFPELTFLALDAFHSYEGGCDAMDLAEEVPNILWDVSGAFSWPFVEAWVRRHGSERLSFGGGVGYSATVPSTQSRLLDDIRNGNLSDEDKANILGRNMRRLFGLPLPD
jgi:predicted TIM-barrel fold metal-dependent hydrolase